MMGKGSRSVRRVSMGVRRVGARTPKVCNLADSISIVVLSTYYILHTAYFDLSTISIFLKSAALEVRCLSKRGRLPEGHAFFLCGYLKVQRLFEALHLLEEIQ